MFRSDDDASANAAAASATDAARELAFRRSLRGSRARRAAAALRRRRALRSRGSALVATAGLLLLSAGAVAETTGGAAAGAGLSEATISAVQRALGMEPDGVLGPSTRRATRRFQRGHGLKVDGRLGPRTLKALGVDPADPQVASAALDPRLAAIAQCESGGDPGAVSANGRYYGKYQFSLKTWRSVGGKGNPADATEAEQDRRAAKLLARDGTKPWPVCG
ncbi:MAG: resuscitation-promoting factor RpfB [Solirubrobacteraceae bacterium]|jgi:peptidoglycan hydrolase-like protein with peptidoglycan-binding domain|nr:resuscitation-promoting factor RpfB [Solirubrobacteraceae bacterium]